MPRGIARLISYCVARPRENSQCGFSKILRDVTDRKRAEEKLRRQSEQLQFLWDSAAALLTASDPQVMMEEMFQRVSEHLDVDAYFNFVVDESDESLRLVSCGGIPEDAAHSIGQSEFGETGADGVVVRRRPVIATHIQQSGDPKAELVKRYGLRTYVCNPLIFQDQLIGTLCFASRRVDQFEPEELAFFKTFAHYITVAYTRLRLVEQLQETHRRKDELEKIEETHPEIVLLDIGLPGMDGYEVAKAVREMPEFDDVLLIALTGYGQEEDRRKSKEAGFDEHLTKPPSVDQMKKVLAHPKLNKLVR